MKRRPVGNVGTSFGFAIVSMFLVCLAASTSWRQPAFAAEAPVEKQLTEREQRAVTLLAFGNELRMLAAGNPDKAISTFAAPEFAKIWESQILPPLKGHEVAWGDFFSSAILFAGRVAWPEAVLVFYNPWSDIALITGVNADSKQLLDGFALCGEILRGEAITKDSIHPVWLKSDTSLAVALAGTYTKTDAALASLYPENAPYEVLPERLRARVHSQSDEAIPLSIRLAGRMEMFAGLVNAVEGSKEYQTRVLTGKLLKAINAGNKGAFLQTVSSAQRGEVTENIFNLPPAILGRMNPNLIFTRDDGAVIALVNPTVPQWFMTVHMTANSSADFAVESVELYRFDLLHLLLQ